MPPMPGAFTALRAMPRHFSKNTSVSWECASESAQSRRYDAVFEIAPSTNSMVSITWWMNT